MAGHPTFTHIHSSSRYSRSGASLEAALDGWMANSSLITLTEVTGLPSRFMALREKGWDSFHATNGARTDDAGICWRKSAWRGQQTWVRKLTGRFRMGGTNANFLSGCWSSTVLLKHVRSGHTLLVSVTHFPSGVAGHGGQRWKQADRFWRDRKASYQETMSTWSGHIHDLVRRKKPDAVLIVADWNLDLKDQWFRDYLNQHWGDLGMRCAWKHFPTTGGSMGGNKIIDGSYYSGMRTDGAVMLPRSASSDHRPYKEVYDLVADAGSGTAAQSGPVKFYDPATGHTKKGVAWWGFGDYAYDEFYEKVKQTDEGVVVTFDFKDPPY